MPSKCWSSGKYQSHCENPRMCSFLLVLLPLHPVLPSTHWVVTENGKIQAQVIIQHQLHNTSSYIITNITVSGSLSLSISFGIWLLLPMKLLWLLLLEMHPLSVSSNHNIHQRIRIINIIVIILTFWTAWQHIFPPSTTRLCSLYSSGGSHKSFLFRIT